MDTELKLHLDCDSWSAETLDRFVQDLLALAAEDYGASTAHVELPMKLWASKPVELATMEEERCRAVKVKGIHQTRTNSSRSVKGSSWRCVLKAGHIGLHQADPAAHQSPWSD